VTKTAQEATQRKPRRQRRAEKHIQFFISQELHARVQQHAEAAGLPITSWIRFVTTKAARRTVQGL